MVAVMWGFVRALVQCRSSLAKGREHRIDGMPHD